MSAISFYPPRFIEILWNSGYPLWHFTANITMRILGCGPTGVAGICSGLWLIVSFIGVLYFMQKWFDKKVNKYVISFLCFILFIVGPIWIP